MDGTKVLDTISILGYKFLQRYFKVHGELAGLASNHKLSPLHLCVGFTLTSYNC